MKYILKEITPLGGNDLFIANHWPDNQMDFPLHFHEDYELNLTLHVRGKRTVGNLVEDFTEKDLVITNPNVLHCYKRGESYANVHCEVVVVQFSKNLPSWGIFDTDQLRPILSNERLFFTDLYKDGVGEKIETMFREMLVGPGAVKAAIHKYVNQ